MNAYQKEHLDAYVMASTHLFSLSDRDIGRFRRLVHEYMEFRKAVEVFHQGHFSTICARTCYDNYRSACCSKDGIIAFFADVVVNVLHSTREEVQDLCSTLETENQGFKCIYLGQKGCLWTVKPIVCEMFLCDEAENLIFRDRPDLREQWAAFQCRKRDFNWPDKPVLFDRIEELFIQEGFSSPLMYFHKSPGLLRVKGQARKASATEKKKNG